MAKLQLLLLLSLLVLGASAWFGCNDESFCNTLRNRGASKFYIERNSIIASDQAGIIEASVINDANKRAYNFTFTSYRDGVYRVELIAADARRKAIPSAVLDDLPTNPITVNYTPDDIEVDDGVNRIAIAINDFALASQHKTSDAYVFVNRKRDMFVDDALAMRFTFPDAHNAYGIPEHGDRLKLKDTINNEPYRHFNLDYGFYQTESRESLYGSVPVLYAHGPTHVSGVFWHNPAQTFVNIDHSDSSVSADFITEAGVLDFFVLPGGKDFKSAVTNYAQLTGTAPLPPQFAMGYHQSRYSYLSQSDLLNVAHKLHENNYPVDVLWLDIDYTNGKRYFTWDYNAFPNPLAMQKELQDMGARLVTIIDPHIKVEDGYKIYDEMKAQHFYTMNPDGQSAYEGNCWPGRSSWVDFFNPAALEWWGGLYRYDNFNDTTPIVHIWNDMNEPAVFDVEEKTMARDIRHYDGILHKEVHNMYGHMQAKGTHLGLLARDNHTQRPFLLTRSHFAGTQRYAAIWTGDNIATWEHLRVSIPICLSEALAGISFCGADVGGFIQRPSEELFQRWYQLGAWYPFFRAHSNNEQDYREPYLYPEDIQARFRAAVHQRYAHIPYWYLVWFEHERYGEPVMRPLVYQYPSDPNVVDMDREFMIGDNVLIAPVLDERADKLEFYLPGKKWFTHPNPQNAQQVKMYESGHHTIDVDMDSVPVFYRAGSLIARKDKVRGSTVDMKSDPYNFYFYLDNYYAQGNLYIDDTVSLDYKNKKYTYLSLSFEGSHLLSEVIDEDAIYVGDLTVGSVYIFYDTQADATQQIRYTQALFKNGDVRRTYPVRHHVNGIIIDFNVSLSDNLVFSVELQ